MVSASSITSAFPMMDTGASFWATPARQGGDTVSILILLFVVVCFAAGVLCALNNDSDTKKGKSPATKPQYGQSWYEPRFNPATGEWEDWDGTPIGAIEDVLMDTDGDGIADDFDGDGMPDDWD